MIATSFLANEVRNNQYIPFAQKEAYINDNKPEDIIDIIISRARKNDKMVTLDELRMQLIEEGII